MRIILFNHQVNPATMTTPLPAVKDGQRAKITSIDGDRGLVRRAMALGIRVGTVVDILSHRGRGVVVGKSGTRVALGGSIAEKLFVETLD